MKILLNLPDTTKSLNVCIVYDTGRTLCMASMMRPTDELRDGAEFTMPARRGSPAEPDEDDYWQDV